MLRLFFTATVLASAATAGSSEPPHLARAVLAHPNQPAEPKIGDRAASGNLIIHVFHQLNSGKPRPVQLKTDYGYMVFTVKMDPPTALYRLASRSAATVENFDSLEAFDAALAKLPKGTTITAYDKCTAPTYYGLDRQMEHFFATCERLGIKRDPERRITCTCP